MERRSSTPAKAGPVKFLFTAWQEAQRLVKMALPSSTGGWASAGTAVERSMASINSFVFMLLLLDLLMQYSHAGR
jgi:hypothetical protein